MRILIGLLKFILGVALALAIIGASGFYAARYVMTRLAVLPERPLFSGEVGNPDAVGNPDTRGALEEGSGPSSDATTSDNETPTDGSDATAASGEDPEATDSATASTPEPELEPGAYKARVIQPIGLILRQGPDISTTQIGGIAYNETVVVLSESSDQRWIKVRLPDSGVEGWVKNGNTEKLN